MTCTTVSPSCLQTTNNTGWTSVVYRKNVRKFRVSVIVLHFSIFQKLITFRTAKRNLLLTLSSTRQTSAICIMYKRNIRKLRGVPNLNVLNTLMYFFRNYNDLYISKRKLFADFKQHEADYK